MANGNQTFKELREIVQEPGRKITTPTALRLIMAGLADIHDQRNADMQHINGKLDGIKLDVTKIKGVTKYPSFLWYLVNMPLKTLAVVLLICLVATIVFVPDARAWAGEQIIKTILGGL